MPCPHCFNERMGTLYNVLEYSTDIVLLHPEGTRL